MDSLHALSLSHRRGRLEDGREAGELLGTPHPQHVRRPRPRRRAEARRVLLPLRALPQRQRPRLLGQTGLCSAALLLDLPQDERRGDGRGRRQLRAGRLRGTSSQHRHPPPLREPAAAVAAQLHPGRARRALIPSEPERGEPFMQIEPYLFFDGRAAEAAEFYKRALGAEVEMLMRFKESPAPASIPPGGGDKVMHMSLKIGGSRVMGSDGHCQGKASRSEEQTSELQSLMRISYAVFCM